MMRSVIIIIFFVAFFSAKCQSLVKFDVPSYAKIIPIEFISVEDSIAIPFCIKRNKRLKLNHIGSNNKDVYLSMNGIQYEYTDFALKKDLKLYLACKGSSQLNMISTSIEFNFTEDDTNLISETYFLIPYLKIFNPNCKSDSITIVKGEDQTRDVLMFQRHGTTTYIKVFKEEIKVFEEGYLNTNILEFDLRKYGEGTYNIQYHPHDTKCEYVVKYIDPTN